MLEFKKLDKDVNIIKPYILNTDALFCDLTLGVKYMWREKIRVLKVYMNLECYNIFCEMYYI